MQVLGKKAGNDFTPKEALKIIDAAAQAGTKDQARVAA